MWHLGTVSLLPGKVLKFGYSPLVFHGKAFQIRLLPAKQSQSHLRLSYRGSKWARKYF